MFLAIGVEGEEIFWSVTQALSNHNNSVTISHAVVITDETKQRVWKISGFYSAQVEEMKGYFYYIKPQSRRI